MKFISKTKEFALWSQMYLDFNLFPPTYYACNLDQIT